MAKNPIEGPQRLKKNTTANTPSRVAPRMQPKAKNRGMRNARRSGR